MRALPWTQAGMTAAVHELLGHNNTWCIAAQLSYAHSGVRLA